MHSTYPATGGTMRRDQRVLGFVVALVLIWDISAASAQQLEKVVIGHSSLRNDIAFLWVPQQLGFFKKNGLDPTIVFISGGVRMIQAIVSESAPIGSTGAVLVTSAAAGGADTIMILGITNLLTYDVWAKPEIKRAEDLKSKTLAISGFGSFSHAEAFRARREARRYYFFSCWRRAYSRSGADYRTNRCDHCRSFCFRTAQRKKFFLSWKSPAAGRPICQ